MIVILVQWGMSEIMSRSLRRISSPILPMLSLLVLFYISMQLFKLLLRPLTTVTGSNNNVERQVIVTVMATLSLLFATAFLLAPSWLVDLRLREGADGLYDAGAPLRRVLAQLGGEFGSEQGIAPAAAMTMTGMTSSEPSPVDDLFNELDANAFGLEGALKVRVCEAGSPLCAL